MESITISAMFFILVVYIRDLPMDFWKDDVWQKWTKYTLHHYSYVCVDCENLSEDYLNVPAKTCPLIGQEKMETPINITECMYLIPHWEANHRMLFTYVNYHGLLEGFIFCDGFECNEKSMDMVVHYYPSTTWIHPLYNLMFGEEYYGFKLYDRGTYHLKVRMFFVLKETELIDGNAVTYECVKNTTLEERESFHIVKYTHGVDIHRKNIHNRKAIRELKRAFLKPEDGTFCSL